MREGSEHVMRNSGRSLDRHGWHGKPVAARPGTAMGMTVGRDMNTSSLLEHGTSEDCPTAQ